MSKECDFKERMHIARTAEAKERARSHRDHLAKNDPITLYQREYDGTPISTFTSYAQAEKITGVQVGYIMSAVRGDRDTAGGFMWVKE